MKKTIAILALATLGMTAANAGVHFGGVYHEFGHSVFARHPSFLARLQQVNKQHFDGIVSHVGPTQPGVRAAQLRRFKQAEEFWCERRLEELFGDLFAQYVAGCANIVSMIDLSMAKGRPAYEMGDADYPPDAARVRACALSLTPIQANESSTKHLLAEWEEYAQQFNDSQLHRDACPDNLLRKFGECVFDALSSALPKVPKAQGPPDLQLAFKPTKVTTFEDAIHQGFAVLGWHRDNFESWWGDVRTRLI